MAKLYILRGAPGSGKSTFAHHLLNAGLADKHFEADLWFYGKNGYKWDPALLQDAHYWCFLSTHAALRGGYNVVVANCFARRMQIQDYVDLGYETEVIELRGKHPNVHGVPPQKVEHIRRIMEEWPGEQSVNRGKRSKVHSPGYAGPEYSQVS